MRRPLQMLPILTVLSLCSCNIPRDDRPAYSSTAQSERIDACREYQTYNHLLIEDFELGIAPTWWLSSDGTGQVLPMPGREPEATLIEGGRCGISKYALRITATGTEIYGGAMGVTFSPAAIDASQYDGISFWGRRGMDSKKVLYFSVSDPFTDEYNSAKQSLKGIPSCLEETDNDNKKCDRYGLGVGLETEWRFFKVPFAEFSQRGYGKKTPELNISQIYGLNIGFETGDWEIWLDDISFYKSL